MKKVLLVILALVCVLGLTACDIDTIFNGEPITRSFELTFDYMDGRATTTITTSGNEVVSLPDDPVREGYTFGGWYFDQGSWQKRLNEDTFLTNPIFINKTVYAKWEERQDDSQLDLTYQIVFETNGGTPVETINTNRIATAPVTTREGYDFKGWFLYETFINQIEFPYVPINDITLYAKWQEKDIIIELTEYTVSYAKGEIAGGDITGTAPADQIILRNHELLLPANPFTKENHDFIGWSDGAAIYAVGEAYTVTADVTFTARWRIRVQPQTFTLSFGPGEGAGITGTAPESADYPNGYEMVLPANPFVRNGYMFVGWFDAVEDKTYAAESTYRTLSRAATLVAKWQIIEYEIQYNNMEGAVNAVSNPATYTIHTPTFTIAEPALSGHSFEGWYADESFITPAATVIQQGSTGDRVFYAMWKRIELSKILNTQGNYVITGYTSNSAEIIVPEKIDNILVTEIAAGAFRNCTTLTTLVIPNSVTRIGAGIINGCHNLTNLTIPFIGEFASGATAANSVMGYLFGEVPLSEPGAVVQNYVDNPTKAFAIGGKLKHVTLTSAHSVLRAAFQNITSLQKVTLNKSVVAIGQMAFSGCSSLTTIDFGEQYTVSTIGANAFAGCTKLQNFSVPNTVTTVGAGCFAGSGIVSLTVPQSVIEIGQGILADTDITTLSVPYIGKSRFYTADNEGVLGYFFQPSSSGVRQFLSDTTTAIYDIPQSLVTLSVTNPTRLMYGALSNCTSLSTLTLGNTLTVIGPYALYNTGITNVSLFSGLTTIDAYAFSSNQNLTSIAVPTTVTTMGNSAFRNCTALDTVNFPEGSRLTVIPENAFRDCAALSLLYLHNGVEVFGDYAFQGCTVLPGVNISTYTTTIGDYAFADCVSLSSGRSDGTQAIIIPSNTTTIGAYAFANCESIRELTFTAGGGLTTIGGHAFANCTGIGTTVSGVRRTIIVIPNNVTTIGDYAFYNCSNVARLDLNKATSKLAVIGDYAFAGWTTLGKNLEGEITIYKLDIPASVITIGNHAFQDAVNLRQINFEGNRLSSIGNYAFAGCSSFGKTLGGAVNEDYILSIPNSVIHIGIYAFAGSLDAENSVRSISFTENSALTSIGEYAFAYCAQISQIYIGKNVSYIGEGAFRGTARLSEINVSLTNLDFLTISGSLYNRLGASSSTTLIKYATGRTETQFTVPSGIIEIGSYAFEKDTKLTHITLPSSVSVIHKNAFEDSTAAIIFDNPTISAIGSYAFYGYLGQTISLPQSIDTLSDYALAGANVSTIVIPEGVTTIGAYVLAGTPVTEVEIPASVTSIGDGAFAGCPTLRTIQVSAENNYYKSVDGVLYRKLSDQDILVQYPAAKQGTSFAVPASVIDIRGRAFEGATGITELHIPDTVSSIEEGALYGLDSLQSLTMPFIGQALFSPTTLGAMFGETDEDTSGAVRQGTAYYVVPSVLDSVTLTRTAILANYTFQNLTLSTIHLGYMVEDIGIYAFQDCTAEVIFGAESTIAEIDAYAFAGYGGQSFNLPDSAQTICEYAFYGAHITEIVFGENTTLSSIEQYAFAESELTSFILPQNISAIGQSVLKGADNLLELTLPFIGENASDTENTLGYLFGTKTYNFEGAIAQTKKNGSTVYSSIPALQTINLAAGVVPVGAFMNVNATTITLTGVSTIAESAFSGCIAQLVFGAESALTDIGRNAFTQYAYQGSLELPQSLTSISQNAFYGAQISDIIFGSEVVSIGDSAFAYCDSLGSLTDEFVLPASLTDIGEYAFYATGIKTVFIPQNVNLIGVSAFGKCYELTAIRVDADNSYYKDINGTLFSKDGKILVQYPAHSQITEVSLPQGVTTILSYAFSGNSAMTSLALPSTLTTIREFAFAGTEEQPMGLSTVTFVGTSNLTIIEQYAFAFCTALNTFTLPASVQEIHEGAFSGSIEAPMGLTEVVIPEGSDLDILGDYAFAYCNLLVSFALPLNILSIGTGVLRGCDSLESLTLPYVGASRAATGRDAVLGYLFGEANETIDGTTLQYYSETEYDYYHIPLSLRSITLTNSTRVSYGAFYGCGTLDEVVLNSEIMTIAEYSFYACTSLRNISIPNKVLTIGAYAFSGTSYRPMSLESVTISEESGISAIGEGAFYHCAALTEFYLPQNLTEISDYTFYQCFSLTTLEMADGSRLVEIGDYAFFGSGVQSMTVPSNLRTIGESAFENSAIQEFNIESGNYRLNTIGDSAFSGCEQLTSFFVPGSLNEDGLGDRVFYNCTAIETVTFGSGALANLGEYAFYNCSSLSQIVLPNALVAVGAYQFYGCRSLTTITLPASVQSIGNYAFAGKDGVAMGLESVVFDGTSSIESIGDYAFHLCYFLESVQMPDSLKIIGEKAFFNCNKLSNLQINATSLLETISDYAFSGCNSLTQIFIPRYVTDIGTGAFRNTALTQIDVDANNTVFMSHEGNLLNKDGSQFIKYATADTRDAYVMPITVTNISDYAFADAVYLTSILLPEGLLTIGEYAFSNTSGLTGFSLPQTVHTIGDYAFTKAKGLITFLFEGNSQLASLGAYAFFNCSSLAEIEIPAGITAIPDSLFYGCTNLFQVIMGDVTEIGRSAFYGCVNLTQIVLPTTLQRIGDYAFYRCVSLSNITISESLTSIGEGAFSGCESLLRFEVSLNNPNYAVSNGALYTKNYNELLFYPAGKTDDTFIINSRTTRIAPYAFLSAKHLKSLSLASRISFIGYRAFYGATSLVIYTQVPLKPSGWDVNWNATCPVYWAATVNYYGTDFQFILDQEGNAVITRYTGDMLSFTFPDYVERIDSTDQIPVIGIGSGAMLGLHSVYSVLIPSTITHIAARAFENNAKLTIYCQAAAPLDGWD
ncbi:MAG: leucine-rich repeat protein, partial [Clostridia bacterium]|nr:leucine-rich repeat protein [Clostridia bacterium]